MAAGSGTRMGGQMPKQFLEIDGKAILQKTIEVFLKSCPGIRVITVLPETFMDYWKEYCYKNNFICPQTLVKGGITRFHSVRNALEKVPEGAVVAVHDGVRPLVSGGLVSEMFGRMDQEQALVPVVPCVDTMKVLDEKLKPVPGAVADRSRLFGVQTPQIFHSELLKQAYRQPYDTSFTDDASVVERYGISPSYVYGERLNIKITTQEDLILARAVVNILRD